MRFSVWAIGAILAGAMVSASGGLSAADSPSPTEIIKARQQHLKDLGGAMKAIGEQVKSGTLDKTIMTEQATKATALAKEIVDWFPKGTGEEAGVKTAAKPEIWAMPDDFKAAAAKLPIETDKLAEVAATGDGPDIMAQLQATGKACQGCHKIFRVPPPEGH